MSETIGREAIFFVSAIGVGVGLGLVYDFFRILRRVIRHGDVWVGLEDVIFWVMSTIVVFLLLYEKNDGMLRAFAFLGIWVGIIIYYLLFSGFVIKLSVLVLGTVRKGIAKVLNIFFSPFIKIGRKILVFMKKRLKKWYKAIKIGLCKL